MLRLDRRNADTMQDAPADNADAIGIEGAMRYMGDLKVQLDDIAVLAIGEALQAPTMGEFTREGFVRGWRTLKCVCLSSRCCCSDGDR